MYITSMIFLEKSPNTTRLKIGSLQIEISVKKVSHKSKFVPLYWCKLLFGGGMKDKTYRRVYNDIKMEQK